MECFRTSAYSTNVDELLLSSIGSMERLAGGLFGGTAEVGVDTFIGLVLVSDDEREEWRGFTSGGVDDEI